MANKFDIQIKKMVVLPLQSSCFANKPHLLLFKTLPTKPRFTITSLDSSSSSSSQSAKPTINNNPIDQSSNSSDKKSISSTGQGFGPAQSPKPSPATGKKKGKRERASIIRRNPVEKPAFLDKKGGVEEDQQQGENERAFLLTWLGLGGIIFVQGIALSASGFLPEEWDKFFVKFLYPSFTPTVFLFVAGTVVYGVLKYKQNENVGNKK